LWPWSLFLSKGGKILLGCELLEYTNCTLYFSQHSLAQYIVKGLICICWLHATLEY
jgi:hypothetical protein